MFSVASRPRSWFPLLAIMAAAAGGLLAWLLIQRFENQTIQLKTSLTTEQVAIRLEDYLNTRLLIVEQMAELRERGQLLNEREFHRHAEGLMQDFPGLLAINWVDKEGIIQWVHPEAPNKKAHWKNLREHPTAASTFLDAERTGQTRVTPPVQLLQGGRGLAAYIPIFYNDQGHGYMNAVFRLGPMIDACLGHELRRNFHFDIRDGDEAVHSSQAPGSLLQSPWRADANLTVGQRKWKLTLAPTDGMLAASSTMLGEGVLLLALLLGVALTLALKRSRTNRDARLHSERRYRQLIELMGEGLCVVNERGEFMYANPQLDAMLGYDSGELQTLVRTPVFDEENARILQEQTDRRRVGETASYELVWKNKNGDPVTTLVSPTPLKNSNGNYSGTLAVVSDLTETKASEAHKEQLEDQLRQAQKLEAIGRLAGGVAHDFNNILTGVIGFSEILQMTIDKDDPAAGYVQQIRKAADRGAALNRQLLAFSRRQVIEPKVLDLKTNIVEAETMLRRVLGEDISISFSVASDLWKLKADPGQIDQLLLNLVVNARDAISEGGWITVDAGNVCLREAFDEREGPNVSGDYVVLSVSDNGFGMDADTLSNIFEPFFTTKEKGKGTGLGLATVYGVVKQNGGEIEVRSEPDVGTTFRIFLPKCVDAQEQMMEAKPAGEDRGGHETILLVEDEEAVRQSARSALEAKGYTVLEACCGKDALALSDARNETIDLLLTDVIMPGMNGRTLAEELQKRRAGIKTLFMSGHVEDVLADQGVLVKGVRLLEKPFSLERLASKVREVIDAP